MSAKKFRIYAKTDYGLDYSEEEAKQLRDNYFKGFPNLKPWHDKVSKQTKRDGYVISKHGHVRHLPSVFSDEEWIAAAAVRQAINTPIQGLGSDIGLQALIRISKQNHPDIHPVLFIHDDCVLEVKEEFAWEAANALVWCMRYHKLKSVFGIELKLPLKGEPDIGYNLGEMHELGDLNDDAPQWIKDLPKIDPLNPTKPSWWNNERDI